MAMRDLPDIYTTLTPQIKGNHRVIYHDIALTTTAFDALAATKYQFPLIIYIELLKVLHCGFELELLKVLHCGFELNMLI